MSDKIIFTDNEPENEKRLMLFYKKTFPAAAAYVARMGGSLEDAKDVFHDATLIWYEKAQPTAVRDAKAYLLGIVKHLWSKRYNSEARLRTAAEEHASGSYPNPEPSAKSVLRLLETAGKKCMDLLQSFYYENLSMAQLAARFGFAGERSATVQKFKCIEKLRQTVKEKSLAYEDFLE